MTSSSNWLRLISTPLPLATTVSGKRSLSFEDLAGGGLSVFAGVAGSAPKTESDPANGRRTRILIIFFITPFSFARLKLDHLDIADVRILLNLVQHFRRRHAIQIQNR